MAVSAYVSWGEARCEAGYMDAWLPLVERSLATGGVPVGELARAIAKEL